jgi:putative transposase
LGSDPTGQDRRTCGVRPHEGLRARRQPRHCRCSSCVRRKGGGTQITHSAGCDQSIYLGFSIGTVEIEFCFSRHSMARQRRVFVPGASVHVIQRGNNRGSVFSDDADCETFLTCLRDASQRCGVAVHDFGLMSTHYHLVVTPTDEHSLPQTVKHFGAQYVQYYNRKHARTGTLWDGRYRGKPIDDDRYLLTCLRYIALNPVKAGIVCRPEAYRWSSYRVHAFGEPCAWLVPHPLYLSLGTTCEQRQLAYRAICAPDADPSESDRS